MQYKFIIPGRLQGLNEYTSANRRNPRAGAEVKRDCETLVIYMIRQQLRGLHISKPVLIYYHFYEPDRRRDNDNVLSCASKFVQDSLVKTQVLAEDNQECIHRFYFDTDVDQQNPRIEVTLTELTPEQQKMNLADILRQLGG
jgi:Holliday junction resolvase RusA-like endonuclease